MSWLAEAFVCVSVVHGDEINITEYEAFVVVFLQGLGVAHIEQFGPVKRLFSILRAGKSSVYVQYTNMLMYMSEQKHDTCDTCAHCLHNTFHVLMKRQNDVENNFFSSNK